MNFAAPTTIHLHRKTRTLELGWADGTRFDLSCEYLRVFSPSAEVRGHGQLEPTLVGGKREVSITQIVPVGRYAVRLVFDDGHDTGLYSWDVFRELGEKHESQWARYLQRLEEHGMTRDSNITKLSALPPGPKKWTPGTH